MEMSQNMNTGGTNDSPVAMPKFSKGWIVFFIALVIALWAIGGYNSLVSKSEGVKNGGALIDTQLQRRFELIPNLVETVKGVTKQEQEVFGKIADARTRYAGAGTLDEKLKAGGEMESALARLLVITENYPQLRSSEAFTSLMAQLEGTENRIQVARRDYNDLVREYNLLVKRFPKSILAKIFGFAEKAYFEVTTPEAQTAPKIGF